MEQPDERGADFIVGQGEMANLIRRKDWSATPLGPIASWPGSLRTVVSLCLASNVPINIIWGPCNTQIYNDAYRTLCGDAHPRMLGEGYEVTWASAWSAIGGPLLRARAGDASLLENQRMFLARNGHLEETFFSLSLSPIRVEDGSVGGVFNPVNETTATMLAERRTRAVRDLSAALEAVTQSQDVGAAVMQALQPFASDLPILLFYEWDEQAQGYRLAAHRGLAAGAQGALALLPLGGHGAWPLRAALRTQEPTVVETLPPSLAGQPCEPYPEPPARAVMLPVAVPDCAYPPALLVAVPSPRLPFDAPYRDFLQLLGSSVAAHLCLSHERRQSAGAIAQSEARLRTIFQASYLFQGLLAPDGRLLDANATALAGIAQPLSAVVGQHVWNTPWFAATPGMPQMLREAVEAALAGQTLRREIRLDLPVGGGRDFDFTLRPVQDDRGAVVAIVAEAVEITDRKRMEAALREAQKLEAVGRLTGGVAHDFNNMMMVMAGGISVLERQPDAARQRQALDGMRRAVARGSALTHQLLTFGGAKPLAPQAIDLAACMARMQVLLDRTLGGQVRVVSQCADGLWPVFADPAELEMVLLNLGVNARDAMPTGGTVAIAAENVGDPQGLPAGEYVRLSVRDTGDGMGPEVRQRAFEPFFTTKEIGKGSGVGLAQVYGFAKESGGTAEIDSAPGRGTTVILLLPRSRTPAALPVPQPAAQPAVSPAPVTTAGKRRVLVVEDDSEVAEVVIEMLEHLGYRTVRASTAAEALFTLEHDSAIDLVFSDVMMPGKLTGVDLARRVRRERPELPVILTSGYAESFKQEARNEGVLVLPKPYAMTELEVMVERALQARVH